jgi:hypothetical protein
VLNGRTLRNRNSFRMDGTKPTCIGLITKCVCVCVCVCVLGRYREVEWVTDNGKEENGEEWDGVTKSPVPGKG